MKAYGNVVRTAEQQYGAAGSPLDTYRKGKHTTTSTKEPATAAAATPYDEADNDGVSKTPLIPKYVYHVNITNISLLLLLLIYIAIVIFQIVFSCYIDCINAAMINDAAAAVRNNNNNNHELNNVYCPHNA